MDKRGNLEKLLWIKDNSNNNNNNSNNSVDNCTVYVKHICCVYLVSEEGQQQNKRNSRKGRAEN